MSVSRYIESRGWVKPNELPINDQGFRCCRYCGQSVRPPKRTFCSPECVHEHRLRSGGTYLRQCVFTRDMGICSICNQDTKDIAKQLLDATPDIKEQLMKQYSIHQKRKITPGKNGGGLWDADHIVRVVDGGGECGMDNIRTLCISCHKLITFSKKPCDMKKVKKVGNVEKVGDTINVGDVN
jgi:5-methylcytosine-specific restriction protein A